MSQQVESYDCPQCDGILRATNNPDEYECAKCGRIIRKSVVERLDAFKRVAKRDGPAAEIARAALEGK